MKRKSIYFFSLALSCASILIAQTSIIHTNPKLVSVEWTTDWGYKSFQVEKIFWTDEIVKELSQQLTKKEVDKIILATTERDNTPCQMRTFCFNAEKRKHADSLYSKLSRLKMYEIATFH